MGIRKILKIALIPLLFLISETGFCQIHIGVFSDCQYCDCEPVGSRYYRNSYDKLKECIRTFNRDRNIFFVAGLGDLIDHGFESYEKINSLIRTSNKMVFNVSGNHDFGVEKEKIVLVPEQLNLVLSYYTVSRRDWMFIFLDGNEISINSIDPEKVRQAEIMIKKLTEEGKPNNFIWNGGVSQIQLAWLEQQLNAATQQRRKVVIFCHYPIYPLEAHSLLNSGEVLDLLRKHNCVKLWMNGHNHAGNYLFSNGIHFVNLKGMVETEYENAFAVVSFYKTNIQIKGFGREESRSLSIDIP